MAIPRKGSRQITVDGQRFRWSIRRKATHSQSDFQSATLTFAVEAAEHKGRLLHVELARPRPDNWHSWYSKTDVVPVTPSEVAKFIRQALRAGWNPVEPGSPFEITERNDRARVA
jgi:hypothetical protein